jgi:hypothetical protein
LAGAGVALYGMLHVEHFEPVSVSVKLTFISTEGGLMQLALKLNVLAVCAVFAFVGAVLLGAF